MFPEERLFRNRILQYQNCIWKLVPDKKREKGVEIVRLPCMSGKVEFLHFIPSFILCIIFFTGSLNPVSHSHDIIHKHTHRLAASDKWKAAQVREKGEKEAYSVLVSLAPVLASPSVD